MLFVYLLPLKCTDPPGEVRLLWFLQAATYWNHSDLLHQSPLGNLLKMQSAGLGSSPSDSDFLGWGPRTCVSQGSLRKRLWPHQAVVKFEAAVRGGHGDHSFPFPWVIVGVCWGANSATPQPPPLRPRPGPDMGLNRGHPGLPVHLRLPSHKQNNWPRLGAQQIFVELTELPWGQLWQETEDPQIPAPVSPRAWLSPHRTNRGRLPDWFQGEGAYGKGVGRGGPFGPWARESFPKERKPRIQVSGQPLPLAVEVGGSQQEGTELPDSSCTDLELTQGPSVPAVYSTI